jgi:hypothetical protein
MSHEAYMRQPAIDAYDEPEDAASSPKGMSLWSSCHSVDTI